MQLRIVFVMYLSYVLPAAAQNENAAPALDDTNLPVTIRVLQDIQINAVAENADAPDDAQPASRYSLVTLGIRKDQQFQMIDIHLQGSCQILFEGKRYDLVACPWLPAFDDHREDIFIVIEDL